MLLLVPVGVLGSEQLLEPPHPGHPEDGDAIVTAEGLQQREVDLQSHVLLIVGRQDAQDHAVRVSNEESCRLVDTDCQAVLFLSSDKKLLQG